MDKIVCFLRRNMWHFIFLAIFLALFIIHNSHAIFDETFLSEKEDVIIGMSGTLLGFIITALSLYYTLPIKDSVKQNLKLYGFDVIIPRTMFMAIVLFALDIVLFLFQINIVLIICLFFFGLSETILATVYLIVLSKKGCR